MIFRALPENTAWTVSFEEVVGFRVFDERDLLEYWPTCYLGINEVHDGGWLASEMERNQILSAGFYGEVREFLVAGSDKCVSVLACVTPTAELLDSDVKT